MKNRNVEIVEKYLNALKNKDLSLADLADELEFEDPVAGKGRGAENLKAFLTGFLPAVTEIRILRHVCEDNYVVTHFEADGVFGRIPVLEMFRIEDEKIVEIIGYYDPRAILGH